VERFPIAVRRMAKQVLRPAVHVLRFAIVVCRRDCATA
jgi:hypothetical protein